MDNKSAPQAPNLIMAIVISVAILFAWDYFMIPQTPINNSIENTQETQGNEETNKDVVIPSADIENIIPENKTFLNADSLLSNSQRVKFENDKISGTVNLETGRFDDVILLNYEESLDDNSKPIRLLAPGKSQQGFFADFGYTSDNKSKEKSLWKLTSGEILSPISPIILTKKSGNLFIERTISLDNNYMFEISDNISNKSSNDIYVTPYGILKKNNADSTSEFVVHTGFIGWIDNVLEEYSFSDLASDYTSNNPLRLPSSIKGWVGLTEKYWMATMVPSADQIKVRAFYHNNSYQTDYVTKTEIIPPNKNITVNHKLFAGAKSVQVIENYQNAGITGFDYSVDWGWFWFFTKPIFKGLLYIYSIIGNYGIAILILTLIIKAIFFPLANKSYTAMSRMKKLQPEMEAIRAKHKDDPLKQQQELVALYKKEKVNPVAGCWPMLLQIPVFYALYKVLSVALELRHAPFAGWITDLAAKDPTSVFNLFGLLPYDPASFIPSFLNIGLLPLLMGITMWMQQRLNPASPDPMQARMMSLFPLIFTFVLAPFAAGLVLYWTWNNILSIIQQALIMKRLGVPVEFRLWGNNSNEKK